VGTLLAMEKFAATAPLLEDEAFIETSEIRLTGELSRALNEQPGELNFSLAQDPESGETFPKLLEENISALDKASEYDYCMVFPVDKNTGGLDKNGARFLSKMHSYGLDIFVFYGARKQQIFAMIRLSLEKLRILADQLEFKMLLDEKKLEERAKIGYPELGIAPVDILHDEDESPLRPYEMIYAKYRDEVDESLYWRPEDLTHPFRYVLCVLMCHIVVYFSLIVEQRIGASKAHDASYRVQAPRRQQSY
jgi:hypothetical protein